MADGDKLTCAICGAEGVGIGFVHDCALVFRVEPNDDPNIDCMLCAGGQKHIPRPLAVSFYTPDGRTSFGLHRHCYDRARIPLRILHVEKIVADARKVLEEDLHDAIVREREAEARARAADVFVQQVPDGFPGEIDVCDATDGHSHRYVPTSTIDTELNLIVGHIEQCANAIAGTPLPHADLTARSLHMLAAALGDHKAHRKESGRNIASEVVEVLRKVGQGSPSA